MPCITSLLSVSTAFVLEHHRLLFSICTTVQGVNIGVGHGPSKRVGKRTASVQALEYLRSYGKVSKIEA